MNEHMGYSYKSEVDGYIWRVFISSPAGETIVNDEMNVLVENVVPRELHITNYICLVSYVSLMRFRDYVTSN